MSRLHATCLPVLSYRARPDVRPKSVRTTPRSAADRRTRKRGRGSAAEAEHAHHERQREQDQDPA
ncbi:MAG: hypothetical protein M3499_02170, partial [Actinomycetota bacterium]|nr:hypothetical protein [Actinomycetota bacterium]